MKMQKVESINTNFDMFYSSGSQIRLHSANGLLAEQRVVKGRNLHQPLNVSFPRHYQVRDNLCSCNVKKKL